MLRTFNNVIANTISFANILYVARDGMLFNIFKVSFLESIKTGVRGAIHEQFLNKINKINIRKHTIKSLMKIYTKMPSHIRSSTNKQS